MPGELKKIKEEEIHNNSKLIIANKVGWMEKDLYLAIPYKILAKVKIEND